MQGYIEKAKWKMNKKQLIVSKFYNFLAKYGTYIIYLFFLVSLILNVLFSFYYFSQKNILLGIWCLVAIYTIPKSVLALILILSYKRSIISLNMSKIIRKLFYRTMQRYFFLKEADLFNRFMIEFVVWFLGSLFPIIYYFQRWIKNN